MPSRTKASSRAALLLACGLLPACSRANATSSSLDPTPIKVQTIAHSEQLARARFSASVEPAVRVSLAFRVNGYVEAVGQVALPGGGQRPLDKGDFVKRGALLARVRSEDYTQKVATARAQSADARAKEKLALVELDRARRLFDSKTITRAEYDAKVSQAESAQANTEGARARQAEAEVALADTLLRAPIDGVILSRPAEIGMLVSPGQEAVTVADISKVKVVFGVPQGVVHQLAIGSPVQIFVDGDVRAARGAERHDAQVTRIAPSADALGRVFSVEAHLDNSSLKLRPGAVVSAHLPSVTQDVAPVVIPLASVIRSPQHRRAFSVFVLDGEADQGRVRLRDVELGEVLGNSVTVLRGLELGQRVVTVGSTLLRDGGGAVVIR